MKVLNHPDDCDLNGSNGAVRLSVSYGDGQTGTALVIRNGSILAGGADLSNVLLGTAEDLHGDSVTVRSTVSQTNKSTPHFSAVHNVSGSQVHEQFIVGDVFDEGTSAAVAETISFK
jgi:hypothetical protein